MVIFADGADKASILELNKNPLVQGFTTNPTLLKKAGVTDFIGFAKDILYYISKPISFEVFTDDMLEMVVQGKYLSSLSGNVYVKIPITDTEGYSTYEVIEILTQAGVKLNITAIMTAEQVKEILPALYGTHGAYISIFAGRIADTGIDPIPVLKKVKRMLGGNVKLLWASPREVLNIYQAKMCDIITCQPELIRKYEILKGKDLIEYSKETVQMFYNDGKGFNIN